MNNIFRNYDNAPIAVKNNYMKQRKYQSLDYVLDMHKKYHTFTKKIAIWDAINMLDNFVDLSDPDITLPNSHHLFQTAEAMKSDGLADWMQLVGLLHDLGKMIYIKGCDKDGTSMEEQWGIVGDTFLVGCVIPNTIVYNEFNDMNIEHQIYKDKPNGKNGIYANGCGLDNCYASYGHDEYLYQVLKYNNVKIPNEGLKIIRYHSMYVWHRENEYEELMNNEDREIKKWVKLFNEYDLYSKENKPINKEELKEYYMPIIEKYCGTELYF